MSTESALIVRPRKSSPLNDPVIREFLDGLAVLIARRILAERKRAEAMEGEKAAC